LLQFVGAAILIPVACLKLMGGATDVAIFTELGVEPHGRVAAGIFELLAGLLLLSPFAATGALLAVGIMLGAAITHLTVLGAVVNDDARTHVVLLAVELASSGTVLALRRKELPVVGSRL
jgi:hypothetical protein